MLAQITLVELPMYMELIKMTKPMIRIHNAETDEVIDREMTNEELAQWEADQAKAAQDKAEAEARATQKAALLDRLGITEDEAKLLLA
jgi:hypothetical protein